MPALRGLDPVELARGKEVPGRPDLTAAYGRYQYSFASPENQAAFAKDPRNLAIQLAGACARMGPLCGAGNPARYVIVDRRIYIFASDSCRDTFKKDPSRYIDQPDAVPTATPETREQGAKLLALALRGFGGERAVDGVKNLQTTLQRSHGTGKDKVDGTLTVTIGFPDRLRNDETWGAWSGAHALSGGDSFERSAKDSRPLEDVEREYLTRELCRHPLALLHARKRPDFVVLGAGKGKVGDTDVELLRVAVGGATSTLSIDPASGRVLAVAYRGRPGIGTIGAIVKTYSDFKAVGNLTLPHAVNVHWEGKLIANQSGAFASVRASVDLDPGFFRAPAAKE